MSLFNIEEVKRHNTEEDAWIVVNGIVYDVTQFAAIHPGGKEILLQNAGEIVTGLMKQEDIHVHSEAAYSLLETYRIGKLANNIDDHDVEESEMKGWKEEKIDWNQGLVLQVHRYGFEYLKWVHSPVNKPLKLFTSRFLEFFSKTPWFLVPMVWLPVILIMTYMSFVNIGHLEYLRSTSNLAKLIFVSVLFIIGVCTWTFVEYILHRFLFHLNPPGDSKFWITLHFFLHGQHHKVPFDPGRLVFPPVAALAFAVPFYLLFVNILPSAIGQGIFAGGLLGYVVYDMTHYYIHHGQPTPGSYLHRLKQYHLKHHFENQNLGFGISSTFWDGPFGTTPSKRK